MIESMALATNNSYDEIISQAQLIANGNGTYKLDLASLNNLVTIAREEVSEVTYKQITEAVTQVQNDILSAISNAATLTY